MADFEKVQYVRQCCFSILPQLYCDRFSITEQIGKIVNALNKLIENNNKLEDYVKEIIREVIESGEIEEIIKDMLANYILNVKYPPEGIEPASGDGTKDDTLAIQGCIDYANLHGGMAVYFPSGSYLTNSLTMKNKSSLIGFDRYSTRLVLKGGAINPLLTGNIDEICVSNITLDGNASVQVNRINVIDISVQNSLFTNLIITNGDTLLRLTTEKNTQINNIIFGNAVNYGGIFLGNGFVYGDNLIFNSISAVSGESFVLLNNSNSILEKVKFIGQAKNGIDVKGSNNNVSYSGDNLLSNFKDTGINNTIVKYNDTKNEKWLNDVVFTSKNLTENIELEKNINAKILTETITDKNTIANNINEDVSENKTGTYNNITETINNTKTTIAETINESVQEKSVVTNKLSINSSEPIAYKTPFDINEYYKGIPLQTLTGEDYNVMVYTENMFNHLYFNVNDWGIYGDGITDVTTKLQTLLNEKKFLYFPPGVYVVSKQLTCSGSCSITGFGTQLSIIKWSNDAESHGFVFTLSKVGNFTSNVTMKDVSLLKDSVTSGTAIKVVGTSTLADRYTIRPILENINIGIHNGSPFSHGWKYGINLTDVNGSVINKCSITGSVSSTGEPNYDSENGIEITGTGSEPHGTEFLITDCKVSLFKRALTSNIFEGIVINSGVYLGCNYGVVINGADKYPHVGITNCHMNCSIRNIWVTKAKEIIISNNLLYMQNVSANDVGANIEIGEECDIVIAHGNLLNTLSNFKTNGFIIQGKYGIITNNIIETTNNSVPVWLTSTSDGWEVRENKIYNSLEILNQGNNNIIGLKTIIPIVTAVPSAPQTGDIWYNNTTNNLQIFNGSVVKSIPAT